MQHPPEILSEMCKLWGNGYLIVEGVKKSRGEESFINKVFARSFYKIIKKVTGFNMENSSDFKLLDRKVINEYLKLPEKKLFFRAVTYWLGFKSIELEFEVRERENGNTKWNFLNLTKYAINNITSFTSAPLQIITFIGVLLFILSAILGIQSLVNYFRGVSLEGFTTIILLLLIIGSSLMISLGLIGYYIAKIYDEVKNRPKYIVSEIARTTLKNFKGVKK